MHKVLVTILAAALTLPLMMAPVQADALNEYRKANGLKPLTYNRKLEKAAARHAQDMAQKNFRSHTGSNGSQVGDRVRKAGYKWCLVSENITWGRSSMAKAVAAWDASPGHKKAMLTRKAREYGIAQVNGIWVAVFARGC